MSGFCGKSRTTTVRPRRMKLLFDEHLSDRALPHLAGAYPGSTHVKAVGLTQSKDSEILAYARTHGFIVVSKDEDLFNLTAWRGHPPKLIHLRAGNIRRAS